MATITGTSGSDSLSGTGTDDLISGLAGNDTLLGNAGNDTLVGGLGADRLDGGLGLDTADYLGSNAGVTVNLISGLGTGGHAQGDTLIAVENVTGSAFNDVLTGSAGDNVLAGGAGNDAIFAGAGNDTVSGGTGADTLDGGSGVDVVDYSASNAAIDINLQTQKVFGGHGAGDRIDGFEGVIGTVFNDTIQGYNFNSVKDGIGVVYGGGGDDIILAVQGDDIAYGGTGNDTLSGSGGDDSLYGDGGNDSLTGGNGEDSLDGGAGDDTAFGGSGDDTLFGGAGNDTLYGEDGNDALTAGDGNDALYGGAGSDTLTGTSNDSLFGGDGDDTFIGGPGVTIDGGENADDMDVLDLTGLGPLKITVDPLNPENGTITFYGPGGVVTGTMTFTNIETVVPCFTPGTMIACEEGEKRVEDLRPGDRVVTRDNGVQVIRWVGQKRLDRAALAAEPKLQPVLIRKGALGAGLPLRDMRVSRQHRMLISGPRAELLFGTEEVLVAAEHLVHLPGVAHAVEPAVRYIHILFDRHEVVLADGAWSESFQPGDRTVAGLDPAAREELLRLFPELAQGQAYPAARPTLKRFEAKLLTAA